MRVVSSSHIAVKMQKVQVKVKIPLLPNPSHSTSDLIVIRLFSVHSQNQSLLVQEFSPFSIRVRFVRLVFHTYGTHGILLRFVLNLRPYTEGDKSLLHTLTLCRFQNMEDHEMVLHSHTFPMARATLKFQTFGETTDNWRCICGHRYC